MSQKVIFSGIQPSGQMSLGNYLGAIKQHIKLQDEGDAIYFIVDLHAITVRQDPKMLRENTYNLAACYLAAGLKPEKCTYFVQSHVPAHSELAWLLNTYTQMGELERMTQFKDKSQRHSNNVNVGLFDYPVLMAADILLYQSDEVPVGDDQVQHVELTRNIAQRFNGVYGDIFKIPKYTLPKAGARVKDLQEPTRKMSKSIDSLGTVFMLDESKVIEKKIKRSVTDNLATVQYDIENQPGVSNLLEIYAACESIDIEDAVKVFEGQQYGTFKQAVADCVVSTMEPIQQKYNEFLADKASIDTILFAGADKASERAEKTLRKVQEAMGFIMKG